MQKTPSQHLPTSTMPTAMPHRSQRVHWALWRCGDGDGDGAPSHRSGDGGCGRGHSGSGAAPVPPPAAVGPKGVPPQKRHQSRCTPPPHLQHPTATSPRLSTGRSPSGHHNTLLTMDEVASASTPCRAHDFRSLRPTPRTQAHTQVHRAPAPVAADEREAKPVPPQVTQLQHQLTRH